MHADEPEKSVATSACSSFHGDSYVEEFSDRQPQPWHDGREQDDDDASGRNEYGKKVDDTSLTSVAAAVETSGSMKRKPKPNSVVPLPPEGAPRQNAQQRTASLDLKTRATSSGALLTHPSPFTHGGVDSDAKSGRILIFGRPSMDLDKLRGEKGGTWNKFKMLASKVNQWAVNEGPH